MLYYPSFVLFLLTFVHAVVGRDGGQCQGLPYKCRESLRDRCDAVEGCYWDSSYWGSCKDSEDDRSDGFAKRCHFFHGDSDRCIRQGCRWTEPVDDTDDDAEDTNFVVAILEFFWDKAILILVFIWSILMTIREYIQFNMRETNPDDFAVFVLVAAVIIGVICCVCRGFRKWSNERRNAETGDLSRGPPNDNSTESLEASIPCRCADKIMGVQETAERTGEEETGEPRDVEASGAVEETETVTPERSG